jgi:LemA protein
MDAFYVFVGLALVALIWFIGTYNGLVRMRNHCRESWSGIDTELKRRHDLIPNLVATVKGYAAHEERVLQQITESRTRATGAGNRVAELCAAENELVRGVRSVFAVAEKADGQFLRLQEELVETEDRIQASRRFYNANVRDLNTRVESLPSSLVAGMASIGTQEFFEVESLAIRVAPQISL